MAEPSSGAIAAAGLVTTVGLGALFPDIDLSALVGAFGGAFFYVVFAKDKSFWQRFGYLIAGWIGGYFGAAEMLGFAWTRTAGFSAFVCGSLVVLLGASLFEWIQSGEMPKWLRWVIRWRTGKET